MLLGPAIGLAIVQALFGASLGRDLPESEDKAAVSFFLSPKRRTRTQSIFLFSAVAMSG